jgi:hypothetical protein
VTPWCGAAPEAVEAGRPADSGQADGGGSTREAQASVGDDRKRQWRWRRLPDVKIRRGAQTT